MAIVLNGTNICAVDVNGFAEFEIVRYTKRGACLLSVARHFALSKVLVVKGRSVFARFLPTRNPLILALQLASHSQINCRIKRIGAHIKRV